MGLIVAAVFAMVGVLVLAYTGWLFKIADGLIRFITGEWILNHQPNGGTVVLLRAVWTAGWLTSIWILGTELLNPSAVPWNFSRQSLSNNLFGSLGNFAAIFAGSYVAYYARFSAQWTYLATVYNQIKAAEIRLGEKENAPTNEESKALLEWKAGFIEDSIDLHLAAKPIFGAVIHAWSKHTGVQRQFVKDCPAGQDGLDKVRITVHKFLKTKYKTWTEPKPDLTPVEIERPVPGAVADSSTSYERP